MSKRPHEPDPKFSEGTKQVKQHYWIQDDPPIHAFMHTHLCLYCGCLYGVVQGRFSKGYKVPDCPARRIL